VSHSPQPYALAEASSAFASVVIGRKSAQLEVEGKGGREREREREREKESGISVSIHCARSY
jgi:hypothetical protein